MGILNNILTTIKIGNESRNALKRQEEYVKTLKTSNDDVAIIGPKSGIINIYLGSSQGEFLGEGKYIFTHKMTRGEDYREWCAINSPKLKVIVDAERVKFSFIEFEEYAHTPTLPQGTHSVLLGVRKEMILILQNYNNWDEEGKEKKRDEERVKDKGFNKEVRDLFVLKY